MDSYLNKHNQHEVMLGRLATHLLNEYSFKSLETAYKAARLILLDNDNISSLTALNKNTSAISKAVSDIISNSWFDVTKELNDTAIYEAGYYQSMFSSANGVELAAIADKKVISTVGNALMTLHSGNQVKSDVWSNYTKKNTASVIDTFNAQIRAGYSNDETLTQIVGRLKTVSGGLLKNNAEALVRTGMSHYATQSREALMQANKELIPNKYYNATFDNRTTDICMSRSGDVYAIDDKSAPVIPAHFGCRSSWLFLVAGQTEPQGTRPAVGAKKTKEAEEAFNRREKALDARRASENVKGQTSSQVKYRGRKDSNIFKAGQISGSTPMDSWMLSQPKFFIEDSLGKGKAELFMSGKISLKNLVDASGRQLTLAQLADKGI